jgi:L-asparaginase/N4-(beta-N-acetylglucosaminyl)-L-asparaginase
MASRREFLKASLLSGAGMAVSAGRLGFAQDRTSAETPGKVGVKPIVVSTWSHGMAANEAAWQVLSAGGNALDAVEAGVRITESDPEVTSVGYGGFPDQNGKVTLDACIMDHSGNAGSVAFLQDIRHPISVARKVMEETPHVMLVGEGALDFALAQGFKRENLLTENARAAWEEWKAKQAQPPVNEENHDTISMLAIDQQGNLSGACTTSGWAWKMPGRVGDSPIIGAGLYVDNEVGAAGATGVGEEIIKSCGSFLVVELMRQGRSPQEACIEAVRRAAARNSNYRELPVCYIAINKAGDIGAYGTKPPFDYAVFDEKKGNRLIKSDTLIP